MRRPARSAVASKFLAVEAPRAGWRDLGNTESFRRELIYAGVMCAR
jgi:hypothetical protein